MGVLAPSMASYKMAIEKYDKGINKVNFVKNLLEEILIIPIGNILSKKINFALADWIRYWRNSMDKNPSIDYFVKFVQ